MIRFEEDYTSAKDFIDQFLNADHQDPKYIFGTNTDAISLASQIEIDGFIEDIKPLSEIEGVPVLKSDQISENALVIIVALMSPISIAKKLDQMGIRYIHYIAFIHYSNLKINIPWFWQGFVEDYASHKMFYMHFDEILEDEVSKKTYQNLMNFRLTGDIQYHQEFSDKQPQQYFEDFLALESNEIFVDVGGFDGQTSLEFIRRCPQYQSVHVFEPEKDNMNGVQKMLSGFENIFYHPYGLSDSPAVLGMISSGSTSKVVEAGSGDYDIEIDKLDNLLKCRATFIKMDIEGAEQKAIVGARQFISTFKPKLAICVYHQGNDFRVIYERIIEMNPNYKVYLRHYTEGIVETVMFFV